MGNNLQILDFGNIEDIKISLNNDSIAFEDSLITTELKTANAEIFKVFMDQCIPIPNTFTDVQKHYLDIVANLFCISYIQLDGETLSIGGRSEGKTGEDYTRATDLLMKILNSFRESCMYKNKAVPYTITDLTMPEYSTCQSYLDKD